MLVDPDIQEDDVKAFEARLQKSIDNLRPYSARWRLFLMLVSILTILCAYLWLTDPDTVNTSLYTSLRAHPVFFISSCTLILLFTVGVHKRVVAPSILVQRLRICLADFGYSITENGTLINKGN
ncbi:unnamed protein product [Oikopleura dioica]|uniref:Nuclear envelope phosphatase-regulatory subunit 1 n=1 Tax=Oikopleura dioica TaxID=34765 RepID=E4XU74_OIKDI|nr:unnamed protein product [Oikopleura dioica]